MWVSEREVNNLLSEVRSLRIEVDKLVGTVASHQVNMQYARNVVTELFDMLGIEFAETRFNNILRFK